jgi:hypothetical protein
MISKTCDVVTPNLGSFWGISLTRLQKTFWPPVHPRHNRSSRFKSAQIGKSEGLKQAMASLRKANSGSFKVGNPGGPGRPKGSRAKLQELAVALLHEDFVEHGADVIKKVRETKPEVYLASVVSLLPKRTEKIESPLVDITDDELEQLQQHLKEIRAKTVERLLELQPDAELPIAQSIDK